MLTFTHSPLADPDLNDAQHFELQSVISKFDRIFSDSPGHTTSASHSINVTQQPFCGHLITICPWQLNLPSNKNWIICYGVSNSPWSFTPIPVRKKDGIIHIMVDYR